MNTINTVAENNVVRYFPFYNGVYIGKTVDGYESAKEATKVVNIPDEVIYKKYFGSKEEYERNHVYFMHIDKNAPECWPYNICKNPEFWRESIYDRRKVYPSKLSFDKDTMLAEIAAIDIKTLPSTTESINRAVEFEKKYDLYPYAYIDRTAFTRAYNAYIKENIEFRVGTIAVSVKWEDESVSSVIPVTDVKFQ